MTVRFKKYEELGKSIDDVITKKKMSALTDSLQDNIHNNRKKTYSSYKNVGNIYKELENAEYTLGLTQKEPMHILSCGE